MIKASRLCECGQPATRSVPDRWPDRHGHIRTLHLCDRCPTPAEIDQRSALVRQSWSDEMHYQKAWDCNRNCVQFRREYDFRDHQAHIGNLTGQVIRVEADD